MKSLLKYIGLATLLFFVSCISDPYANSNYKPRSYGKLNQIDLIVDDELWESDFQDTVLNYYQAPFLLLPVPEPILDIRRFNVEALTNKPSNQVQKVIVLAGDMNDDNSPTTLFIKESIGQENLLRAKENENASIIVGRDRWAKDQSIIYILGFGEEHLKENIRKSFIKVAQKVKEANTEMLHAQTYPEGIGRDLSEQVRNKFGIAMEIPMEYINVEKAEDENFIWLRRDKHIETSNIFIYKFPYKSKEELSNEKLKEIHNMLGAKYVDSDTPGSVMQINDVSLPIFYYNRTVDNQFAIEARGVWEMSKDFVGGPFMAYLIHNPTTNELIFIDGFVLAPGEPKRNMMLRIEHILERVKVE